MINAEESLNGLRETIDTLDAGIIDLLDRRMRTALKIIEAKRELGKDVYDKVREDALYELLKKRNETTIIPDEKILEIWGKIVEVSRGIQSDFSK